MESNMEIWKPIERFNGEYLVSNHGRLRSLKRHNDRLMPMTIQQRGYYAAMFHMNNKAICVKVHRLVAETFIPNPEHLPEINHKDGNKLNNNADNLEWCTRSQNMLHSWGTGLHHHAEWTEERRKEYSERGKLLWQERCKRLGIVPKRKRTREEYNEERRKRKEQRKLLEAMRPKGKPGRPRKKTGGGDFSRGQKIPE